MFKSIIPILGALIFCLAYANLYRRHSRLRDQLCQATKQSRRHQANFQAVMDHSPDALFIIDRRGAIEFFSRAAEKLFGYTAAEIAGHPFSKLLSGDAPPLIQLNFDAEAQTDRLEVSEFAGEVMGSVKDGTQIPIALLLKPFSTDEQTRLVGIAHDLSKRYHLEEQLRQAQKTETLGRLTGGIIHDFNNMLTIITGQSELLLNELVTDNDTVRQEISEINTVCQRATRLTHQLLAFSRRQTVQPYPLDLNLVIAGLGEMLQRVTGEKIELVLQLGEKIGKIEADPGQIEQVLLNLVLNAVDAMPTGGRLTIETHEVTTPNRTQPGTFDGDQPFIQLMITDTGVGMNAETVAHALEPFFTTKAPGEGTGIGLATVDTIVRQCGGWVEITSQPDRGANFSLYFPKVEDHIHSSEKNAHPQGEPVGGSETILLVEDEAGVRMITRRILERHGYQILEADSAQQGLDVGQAHSESIDLLLSDVIMPGMSGHELAAQLICIYPNMKTLYMSGYTNEALDRHGVVDTELVLLEKPFTAERLIRRVRETLDAKAEPIQ